MRLGDSQLAAPSLLPYEIISIWCRCGGRSRHRRCRRV